MMKTTEIFELRTEADVLLFCRTIAALKRRAPGSLRYTVALTAERRVKFKEVEDGANGGRRLVAGTLASVSKKL